MENSEQSTTTTTLEGEKQERDITKIVVAKEAQEGDGARVKRSIGTRTLPDLDPFLMLDEFFVEPPAGFPDHPHRGFETVTYMLDGKFRHADNKGHAGTIGPGDVQWMTAGRGIVHSETPATDGVNHGLQLWVNLHSTHKMSEPRYQELTKDEIPVATQEGVTVRVIAGESYGVKASVFTRTPTTYLDVSLKEGSTFEQHVPSEYDGFVYILQGKGSFGREEKAGKEGECLVLGKGDHLTVRADASSDLRFVVIAGKPLREPVAKYGPFVMNTRQEIEQAFIDYQTGKF